MQRTATLGLCVGLALSTFGGANAQVRGADDYPQRTVTFLCPFPAGGGTDILTRMLAQELQDKLKRTFIVENRPGAGTIVAAQAAARAAPDGYTIFLAPVTTLALGPNIYKTLPYDTVKDFAPISLVGSSQFALIANPKIGADTLPELIALIRRKDGQMSFAQLGRVDAASPVHGDVPQDDRRQGAACALSRQRGGADRHRLGPDPVHDRRSRGRHSGDQRGQGEGIRRHVARQRVKAMPDLPTIAEAGVPGYGPPAGSRWWRRPRRRGRSSTSSTRCWWPSSTGRKPTTRCNALAITPLTSTPDELARLIPAEIKKWAQVVKDAGITPE